MAIYHIGDLARLAVTFNGASETPADPTSISLLVQAPDGTRTTYNSVTRVATGKYYFDLPITQAGPDAITPAYFYRWVATGAVQTVQEGSLIVAPTIFPPASPAAPSGPPAVSLSDLQAARVQLVMALGNPRLSVRTPDGKEITYRSVREIEMAIGVIDDEIRILSGQDGIRTALASFSRNDGPNVAYPWSFPQFLE